VGTRGPTGEARRTIAPPFSTSLVRVVLLTVFLPRAEHQAQQRWSGHVSGRPSRYTPQVRAYRARPSHPRGSRDVQAHVSAERPSPVQASRLPSPHADPCRTGDPLAPAREGPRSALGLRTTNLEVRRVLADGRGFHGDRVVVFVAPGAGEVAFVAGRRVGGAVVRNRARRILRAAWRELASGVRDGYDVVLVAREAIRGARSHELVSEVDGLLARARIRR
jgi:ribonuclease P protein component